MIKSIEILDKLLLFKYNIHYFKSTQSINLENLYEGAVDREL